MECAKCGYGLNHDDSNYCVNCGATLREGHPMALYDTSTHMCVSNKEMEAWFKDHPVMPKTERFFCRKGSEFHMVVLLILCIALLPLCLWITIYLYPEVSIWGQLDIWPLKRWIFLVACLLGPFSFVGIVSLLTYGLYDMKSFESIPFFYKGKISFLTRKNSDYNWLVDEKGNLLIPKPFQLDRTWRAIKEDSFNIIENGSRIKYRPDGSRA